MKPLHAVIVTVAVFLTGCGRSDQDRLQGSWLAISGEERGKPRSKEELRYQKFKFAGDKITVYGDGSETTVTYRIDEKKNPKEIDIPLPERALAGIYELTDDKLTLCAGRKARPTAFKSSKDDDSAIMYLKRE